MQYYINDDIRVMISRKPSLMPFVKSALFLGYGQIFIHEVCSDGSTFGDRRRSQVVEDAVRSGMSADDVEFET